MDHQRCGRDAIVWRGRQQEIDYVEAERGWELAKAAISSGLYKTIILDELNPTVDLELLESEPIVQALLRKPRDTEVIITGRCHDALPYFDLATVHSEMVCHKHYAEQGGRSQARCGLLRQALPFTPDQVLGHQSGAYL